MDVKRFEQAQEPGKCYIKAAIIISITFITSGFDGSVSGSLSFKLDQRVRSTSEI